MLLSGRCFHEPDHREHHSISNPEPCHVSVAWLLRASVDLLGLNRKDRGVNVMFKTLTLTQAELDEALAHFWTEGTRYADELGEDDPIWLAYQCASGRHIDINAYGDGPDVWLTIYGCDVALEDGEEVVSTNCDKEQVVGTINGYDFQLAAQERYCTWWRDGSRSDVFPRCDISTYAERFSFDGDKLLLSGSVEMLDAEGDAVGGVELMS